MKYFIYGSFLLLLAACTKETETTIEDDPNPAISDTPFLDSLTLNKTTVQEFSDSLVFRFKFLDGDGDVGEYNADSTCIELIDTRDVQNLVFRYHLSPRAPQGADVSVQGWLELVLENPIRLDDANASESTVFLIRLKDRADRWSNTLSSPTVTIQG